MEETKHKKSDLSSTSTEENTQIYIFSLLVVIVSCPHRSLLRIVDAETNTSAVVTTRCSHRRSLMVHHTKIEREKWAAPVYRFQNESSPWSPLRPPPQSQIACCFFPCFSCSRLVLLIVLTFRCQQFGTHWARDASLIVNDVRCNSNKPQAFSETTARNETILKSKGEKRLHVECNRKICKKPANRLQNSERKKNPKFCFDFVKQLPITDQLIETINICTSEIGEEGPRLRTIMESERVADIEYENDKSSFQWLLISRGCSAHFDFNRILALGREQNVVHTHTWQLRCAQRMIANMKLKEKVEIVLCTKLWGRAIND